MQIEYLSHTGSNTFNFTRKNRPEPIEIGPKSRRCVWHLLQFFNRNISAKTALHSAKIECSKNRQTRQYGKIETTQTTAIFAAHSGSYGQNPVTISKMNHQPSINNAGPQPQDYLP
ncbi:MAG: hypothetical protein COA47_17235 [Robiginitomaculum sp.]|nr:MAG: hypothetical protein COA47_17235 [Robiginitomaculum sp.]